MRNYPWQDWELRLLSKPLTNRQIADRTGRTIMSVFNARRKRHIVSPLNYPTPSEEFVRELYETHVESLSSFDLNTDRMLCDPRMSASQIARLTGRALATVQRRRRRLIQIQARKGTFSL